MGRRVRLPRVPDHPAHVIEELETDILALEDGSPEALDAFKRRVHTMKGEAGVLGLHDFQEVCHAIEDFVGSLSRFEPDTIDRLFTVHDWLGQALSAYGLRRLPEPRGRSIIAEQLSGEPGDPPAAEAPASVPTPPVLGEGIANEMGEGGDADGMQFLREACSGLAEAERILVAVEMSGPSSPAIDGLIRVFRTIDGMAEVLEFEAVLSLTSTTVQLLEACRRGAPRLEGVVLDLLFDVAHSVLSTLEAVLASGDLESNVAYSSDDIPELVGQIERAVRGILPDEVPVPLASIDDKVGDVLLQHGKVREADILRALEAQRETGRKLGEELVAMGCVRAKDVAHALRARKRAERRASNLTPVEVRETVRVDTSRIDELIEIVGELVISQSILSGAKELRRLDAPKVRGALLRLGKLTRDLQDVGMRMRMVPVRGLFQKMNRATRELSRKLNRDILLAMEGAETEIDRSMVERLADPLLHMIRNSVDHGIEPPEERRKAGKPLRGTIRLGARHEGASIIIEVADDGRGLNLDRILEKARDRGLVEPQDGLSRGQITKLIFSPGFSTAEKVSDVSGRGVGMDVVRRHIEAMRGRVSVSSEPGKGTTFSITLPLTLAVIDGTLVQAGGERYIVPTLSIIESLRPSQSRVHLLGNGTEIIDVGDQSLPLVSLSDLLGVERQSEIRGGGHVILTESLGHRLALLVDDIEGHQQVVIKNLGSYFHDDRFLAGAAILPDGNVGLILNVDEIVTLVDERRGGARATARR